MDSSSHDADIVRASPALLCSIDEQGRLLRVNPAWTSVLGRPEQDLVGTALHRLVHPDDVESTLAALSNARNDRDGRARETFQNRCRCADGSFRRLSWQISWDSRSSLGHATGQDITESHDATERLSGALAEALEAARAKARFLATMSHEIRTPLGGVVGLSNLLAGTVLDTEQERYVQGIRTAGEVLMSVINDVLDLSKLEAGRFVLDELDFDPASLVHDVHTISELAATSRGLWLRVDTDPELPGALRGDPGRLRQILINLVGNAVKFTHAGGVTLTARLAAPKEAGTLSCLPGDVLIVLEVADTGIGMDQATQQRIFEPFSQADVSTARRYGGTGLGLAISRELVTTMGGSLSVRSTEGSGTVFQVVVPLGLPEALDEPAAAPGGLPMLVVSDDPEAVDLIVAQVTAWATGVEVAADHQHALDLLRQHSADAQSFDAAIIDLPGPGTPGLDLADAIAAHPGIRSMPVILVTSGEDLPEQRARRARVAVRIARPLTPTALQEALTRVTGRRPAGAHRERPGQHRVPEEPATGRGRVLLVEDDDINQMVATGILTKIGYQVDVACDGLEALSKSPDEAYRAILMDCQMPNMDGYTATARLRQRPDTARIPIIAMTANAFVEDRDRCIAAGMDDFLTKPVRARDLEETLARWTRAAATP